VTLTGRHGTVVALAIIAAFTVAIPWLTSQIWPIWAPRYLNAALGPTLLLCAAAIASVGRLGLAALAAIAIVWTTTPAPGQKSSVRDVAAAISPALRPGDLILSTHPGEIAVLSYYLPGDLRYATLTGPVHDLGVTDWRDLVTRLRLTSPARDLQPLIDDLPAGQRLVLVEPIIYHPSRWNAPSRALVRDRSGEWHRYLDRDQSLRQLTVEPESPLARRPKPTIRATVYLKAPRAGQVGRLDPPGRAPGRRS
jgi:hypothetical protein